jgi:hypothetical protein
LRAAAKIYGECAVGASLKYHPEGGDRHIKQYRLKDGLLRPLPLEHYLHPTGARR